MGGPPPKCMPAPGGGVRSSCGPCAKEQASPRAQLPAFMKGWHSRVLYMGRCAPPPGAPCAVHRGRCCPFWLLVSKNSSLQP